MSLNKVALHVGFLLCCSLQVGAENWSCRDTITRHTIITNSPNPSLTIVCEQYQDQGAFNRLTSEQFSRLGGAGEKTFGVKARSPEPSGLVSRKDLRSKNGDDAIRLDWHAEEIGVRNKRSRCKVWGTLRAATAMPLNVLITRGALAIDIIPVTSKNSFRSVEWKTTLEGACRGAVAAVQPND